MDQPQRQRLNTLLGRVELGQPLVQTIFGEASHRVRMYRLMRPTCNVQRRQHILGFNDYAKCTDNTQYYIYGFFYYFYFLI